MNGLFTADPTARNWNDGKIWLYTSHDVPCMSCYSAMNDWHAFSSSDGLTWKNHGSVLSLDKLNADGWKVYNAWAPECVKKDGVYYFYFPVRSMEDKSWLIGVATSKISQGPFTDPAIVTRDWGIDPAVLIDDDGNAYLYCQHKMGQLNADLITVKEETVVNLKDVANLPHTHNEGPFVFKRNDVYYYVCSSFGYRKLVYFTSDQPLGPWEYKGVIMENDPEPAENNHCSIVKFKGKWILFYHKKVCGKARNVCADYLEFDPEGGIKPIHRTKDGIFFK